MLQWEAKPWLVVNRGTPAHCGEWGGGQSLGWQKGTPDHHGESGGGQSLGWWSAEGPLLTVGNMGSVLRPCTPAAAPGKVQLHWFSHT